MIADLAAINPAYLLLAAVAAYYIVPYLKRWHLRSIPTPSVAGFTNLWLLIQARRGNRFEVVDNLHKKHGKLVRLAPRHVSIADDAAINAIYGHGNGFLKA
jgi:benzoate 4-monooxygenase